MTTPPACYPVDLAQVRGQLNIDTEDYDARLAGLVAAATEWVETYTGRALISRQYSGFLNWWPSDPRGHIRPYVQLEKPPLISVVDVITYDDADAPTTFASTNYYVDTVRTPGRIMLRRGQVWPIPLRLANGIQIDWTAGYGPNPANVPEMIRLAIQVLVGAFNEQRGDDMGEMAIPAAVTSLLAPFLYWPPS